MFLFTNKGQFFNPNTIDIIILVLMASQWLDLGTSPGPPFFMVGYKRHTKTRRDLKTVEEACGFAIHSVAQQNTL